MNYDRFNIVNYKGINNIEVELNAPPSSPVITLVGLNESGKTTILEAINLFKNELDESLSYKYIPKHLKHNFNGNIIISAYLTTTESDFSKIKEFIKNKYNEKLQRINGLIDDKILKVQKIYKFSNSKIVEYSTVWDIDFSVRVDARNKKISKSENSSQWGEITDYIFESLIPNIIYYPNFLYNIPSKIYLKDYPENKDVDIQRTYRDIIKDILDSLNESGLNLETSILKRLEADTEADRDSLEALLDKMSSKITTQISNSWEKMFKDRESAHNRIVLEKGIDNAKYYLTIKLKENNETFSIDERSLGFKWFFTFTLFTEFRKNRHKEGALFLLDEPASNLHSTAQVRLLEKFKEIVKDGNITLIYTTHSHHLINPKWLNSAYIVKNKAIDYNTENLSEKSKNTDITIELYKRFISKYPNDQMYFKPILDTLEYQPSLLENVPNIVITEGKNDYYTLKYVKEIILKDDSEIHIYPGNGVAKLDDIFRLYLAWGRDFISIFDNDKAGIDQKKRYIKEIGPDMSTKIFLLKDIDSLLNGQILVMEDLFTTNEQIDIVKLGLGENRVNKDLLNKSIQQLYIDETVITLSDETKEKFKKIIDFIKGELS